MLRRLALAALLALVPQLAAAQFATIGPTPPNGDNGDRLATTAWVTTAIGGGSLALASGKIFIGSAGNIATGQTPSGDCTLSLTGVVTCTQSAGAFTINGIASITGGILATSIAAPSTPAAGKTQVYVDSTQKVLSSKNDAGTVSNTVVPSTAGANQFANSISAAGAVGYAQPAFSNLSGSVTCAQEPAFTGDVTTSAGSCAHTLATVNANTGSWGTATQVPQFTVNGKGLVTAAANVTVTPAIGSITGLGTGVATALGLATNVSGGVVTPTPTRAGDIIYWSGSAWVTLAGNNSGTQVLQENASGVPAWATVAGSGTMTTATAGYGITLSSGATCTTSCTVSVSLTSLSNYLSADVALNNIASFFPGPTVAQGTSGTWYASGCITGASTGTADAFVMKLWDGTTVISSGLFRAGSTQGASGSCVSGIITSPAGNLRIDVQDLTGTGGTMKFNSTGLSKDSFIVVYRLG